MSTQTASVSLNTDYIKSRIGVLRVIEAVSALFFFKIISDIVFQAANCCYNQKRPQGSACGGGGKTFAPDFQIISIKFSFSLII